MYACPDCGRGRNVNAIPCKYCASNQKAEYSRKKMALAIAGVVLGSLLVKAVIAAGK